ncbi:MAG: DUF2075 domain-containing protein, partial [Candidatus Margulisiibacteriota bacterium]
MRLYAGTSRQFIEDSIHNQIADKLKQAFFAYFRFNPSPAEITSWKNSLRAISQVFQYSNLLDHGVILEYQLPLSSKRLDCIICGFDKKEKENAIIIELKQWEQCEKADGANEVLTWLGGKKREVLHPSAQVGQYQLYLQDTHTAFYKGNNPIHLNACTYLHNYKYDSKDVLFASKFSDLIIKFPLFTADDVDTLKVYLTKKLEQGNGTDVLKRIEESKYRPNKKLMDHVSNVIKHQPEYVLLDEQLIVYDKVIACAKKGFRDKNKTVLIIRGGPGTGKSVIAINLMADLLKEGFNAQYATGSKTFTETLRKIIGRRGSVQFNYFNGYSRAENNAVDVLICDEAHRIRETSANRFTRRELRTGTPQIEELIKTAKVVVFFIDDDQIVRPNEIGSVKYIKQFASKNNCAIFEYELDVQFRCNGSEAFINWINNTLGIKRTANVIWDLHEEFDFKIFDNPHSLHKAIEKKNKDKPNSARLVTGYCWPWSEPRSDGSLVEDVVIDDFKMPWEKKDKFWEWAHEDSGMNQMGTVYTAQGFEFDYIGVIIGPDLTYNLDKTIWEGHPECSHDSMVKRSKEKFTEMVKNAYRVLLSRGMKGCYV